MTTIRILPALLLSTVLAGMAAGPAFAQTATDDPNKVIEQQVEERATARTEEPGRNTLGEAAATAQTHQPIGSGAAVEWVGKPIAAIDGTQVGTVSAVETDPSGTVTQVRAKVGGVFGLFRREVAIPIARILLEQNGTVVAEMSAEEIRRSRPTSG